MSSDHDDRITLTLIRGEIAGLPEADQAKVRAAAQLLRDVIAAHDKHGILAMALVGAELQLMAV